MPNRYCSQQKKCDRRSGDKNRAPCCACGDRENALRRDEWLLSDTCDIRVRPTGIYKRLSLLISFQQIPTRFMVGLQVDLILDHPRFGQDLRHVGDESVAAPTDGLHVSRLPSVITERLSEPLDVEGEVGFLDKGIRPQATHQLVLSHDSAVLFYEDQERLKNLWCEGNGLFSAQEYALICVQREVSEPVEMSDGVRHNR